MDVLDVLAPTLGLFLLIQIPPEILEVDLTMVLEGLEDLLQLFQRSSKHALSKSFCMIWGIQIMILRNEWQSIIFAYFSQLFYPL